MLGSELLHIYVFPFPLVKLLSTLHIIHKSCIMQSPKAKVNKSDKYSMNKILQFAE